MESQQRISTRQLVDSDAEHRVLEALIEGKKPPAPGDVAAAGLHFLLFSPFRYPPLRHGSRFATRLHPSLWYGSEKLETALAEAAYYQLVFFHGSRAKLLPNRVPKSAFQAAVSSSAAVDLTLNPFDRHRAAISSPVDYAEAQKLGAEMRSDGVEMFRYFSARDPRGGVNIALFTASAFALKRPIAASQTWTCTTTQTGVSWYLDDVATETRLEFSRSTLLVDGKLPVPSL